MNKQLTKNDNHNNPKSDYYLSCDLPAPTQNQLSFLLISCRSLASNFTSLQSLINSSNISYDIIALTETWISVNDSKDTYSLDDYILKTSSTRTQRGGGVVLYINLRPTKSRSYINSSLFNNLQCEMLQLRISNVYESIGVFLKNI